MNFEIPPADYLTKKFILNPVEDSRSAPTRSSVMGWQWGQVPWKLFPYIQVSDVLRYKPIPIIMTEWVNKARQYNLLTLLLKLSQYAAQSLTRKNCATSKTFHSAGTSSPGSPMLPVASTNLGISFPLAPVDWKVN